MITPFLTSAFLSIDEKCPECNTKLSIKISYNGMPFLACDKCSYKKELILFRKCPKCKGNLKLIHKHGKLKCENCNTWFKLSIEEEGSNSQPEILFVLKQISKELENLYKDVEKLRQLVLTYIK